MSHTSVHTYVRHQGRQTPEAELVARLRARLASEGIASEDCPAGTWRDCERVAVDDDGQPTGGVELDACCTFNVTVSDDHVARARQVLAELARGEEAPPAPVAPKRDPAAAWAAALAKTRQLEEELGKSKPPLPMTWRSE